MCLLAVAFQTQIDRPLIVTSNRDEFYRRPTEPMHWWPDAPILAGRDAEAGGTWMGLSRSGRFAAVTNFRQLVAGAMPETNALSRGHLVTDFLSSEKIVEQWADSIAATMPHYGGFNLLLYDGLSLLYLNNHDDLNNFISLYSCFAFLGSATTKEFTGRAIFKITKRFIVNYIGFRYIHRCFLCWI